MSEENGKCYFLHSICGLILIFDFNSQLKVLQNTKVPKPENKVLNPGNKVPQAENKVLHDIPQMCYISYCNV